MVQVEENFKSLQKSLP